MSMGLVMLGRCIHTPERLVHEPSVFEVQMATEKPKRHKTPGTDEIPADFIKAGSRIILSEIHKLINSIFNLLKPSGFFPYHQV